MEKTTFTKGIMVLAAGIVLASCTKTDVFEENQKNYGEQQKKEYKENYIAKYGQPDANQSWDFAGQATTAKTRSDWAVEYKINVFGQYKQTVKRDMDYLKAHINDGTAKDWNPFLAIEMYIALAHGDGNSYRYWHLEIYHDGEYEEVIPNINVRNNSWYDAAPGGTLNKNDHYFISVDTRSLTSAADAYWVAYYQHESAKTAENNEILDNLANFKLLKYKECTVNGETYWGFDCSGDEDYSDLIFLVRNVDPVRPVEKRYMVEDLGSKDDFDFNDIVFDVKQDIYGKQQCIIRAMGGTLDFTLHVGNSTWTKSVDGVAAGYNVGTMYNTQTIEGGKELAKFEVTGWEPANNNVSVDVVSNVGQSVIVSIPFPKKGEVPMIIAFDTFYAWMAERESLRNDWWYPVTEDTEE